MARMPQKQRDNDYYFQYVLALDDPRLELDKYEINFVESMLTYFPEVLSENQIHFIRKTVKKYLGEEVE